MEISIRGGVSESMEISILFFFWTLPLMLIETWGNTIRSKTNFGQMLMIKYNMSLNLITNQVTLPRSKHLDHTNEYFTTDQSRTTPIHLLLPSPATLEGELKYSRDLWPFPPNIVAFCPWPTLNNPLWWDIPSKSWSHSVQAFALIRLCFVIKVKCD